MDDVGGGSGGIGEGGYYPGSPLRESRLGMFDENASQPPTPPSNIRNLIAHKEKVRYSRPLSRGLADAPVAHLYSSTSAPTSPLDAPQAKPETLNPEP